MAFVDVQDELAHETFQKDREQTGLPEGQVRPSSSCIPAVSLDVVGC